MPKDTRDLRQDIIDACLKMNALGINQGSAGNIGVRVDDGLLITPSGMPYDSLTPDDIVFMAADGSVPPGQKNPSSEWRFHLDILNARGDAGAVVHSHAMFATTLACLHREIPAFHYMVAIAGGRDIRCAPYATFGTRDLSDSILVALRDRKACLMANHGLICLEQSLPLALRLAIEVEHLANAYRQSLEIGGPVLLDNEEMDRVVEKFRHYGPDAQ